MQGTGRYGAGDVVYTYIITSCNAWKDTDNVCTEAAKYPMRGFTMGKDADDNEKELTSATALAAGALTALAALAL